MFLHVLTKLSMYLLYHSLNCTKGCNPIKKDTDAKIQMDCQGQAQCPEIVWNIEDPSNDWPVSLINEF